MKLVALGEVCEVVNGGTPDTKVSKYWNGEHAWITPAEMGNLASPYLSSSRRKLTDEGLRNSSAQLLPTYSVILSSRAPIGHLVINDVPMASNQGCKGLIPSKILHHKYLYYFLYANKEYLNSLGSGTTFAEISGSKLKTVLIPLPSLDEQQSIVEKLDRLFSELDLLEINFRLIEERVDQLSLSVTHHSFASEGIEEVALGDIVDILDNLRVPINATERQQRLGDVPYYGATGQVGTIDKPIFNETLILLGEDGVPFFEPNKNKAYEISGPAWVNNHAHVLRAKPQRVVQRYLLHFLNIFDYSGYVNGATRLKLTQGEMRKIPVPLPKIEKQEEIVMSIDNTFEEIVILRSKLRIMKEMSLNLRQSILHETFSLQEGKVS